MLCAASTCKNDIDQIIKVWEENGRKGRPPKYCHDPECQRVRVAERNRRSRRLRRPRSAVPRNWDQLPEDIDFKDTDTWHATVAEARRLEAMPKGPPPEFWSRLDERVECLDCGRELWSTMHAIRAFDQPGRRYRCQSCAAAA